MATQMCATVPSFLQVLLVKVWLPGMSLLEGQHAFCCQQAQCGFSDVFPQAPKGASMPVF